MLRQGTASETGHRQQTLTI